jgi:transcriptional regulator with XRE-family HTH domain
VPAPADEELRALVETVQALRLQRGLTQEAVGLGGGLGRKYVGELERGELVPSYPSVVGVAHGLSMSPAEFFRMLAEHLENGAIGG